MAGIEISLLLIGSIFMLGSFFISEKLSTSELNKIAELSDEELKKIIDKGISNAGLKIDDLIDGKLDEAVEKTEVVMEKQSNLKIMAIHEYSDTVFESMKKTHDEIMFLYSMLNDKHTELTSLTGELQRLAADVRNLQETFPTQEERRNPGKTEFPMAHGIEKISADEQLALIQQESAVQPVSEPVFRKVQEEDNSLENHNEKILALYQEGFSKIDIARKLGLGIGEVSLVIGLYKGDVN